MENFEIIFYETENGEVPAWDFITSLDDNKMKAKLLSMLEILSEKGTNLRLPYSEHLDDGIFELRCKQGAGAQPCGRGAYPHNQSRPGWYEF